MGFLKAAAATRIDLADLDVEYVGYWVDMKPQLTRSEKRGVERAMFMAPVEFAGTGGSAQVSGSMRPDVVGAQDALLVESILAWNLTDEADQPLPTSPQTALLDSLGRLPDRVFDFLYLHVSRSNKGRTKEEQARFPSVADAGGEGGQGGPAEPGPVLDAGGPVAEVGAPA